MRCTGTLFILFASPTLFLIHACYLVEVAEWEGIPGEGKAVPRSPGGSSLEGEGNHTHPDVRVCVCECVHVCVITYYSKR